MKKMITKLSIAALVLVSVLLILYLLGRKSVHTEVSIPASPKAVWAVLTDFSTVSEWNEVLVPVEGELEVGNEITYQFFQEPEGEATEMTARVEELETEQLIRQSGGMTGILTFNHQYQLEAEGIGTRVTIHEEYRGIMVPFWNPDPVEKAYGRLLNSLKRRVTELK